MNPIQEYMLNQTRRAFLGRTATGIGSMALASMLNPAALSPARAAAAPDPRSGLLGAPHWAPKARRVIHLYMAGGPSHLETLDYKPRLAELHGKPMPESFTKGQQIAQLQGAKLTCFAPQHPFERYGRSGQSICSKFHHIGAVSDEICIIRSMHTDQINHDTAHTLMNTGTAIAGRPSMGSWFLYGLGSECDNLPGFVIMTSVGGGGQAQPISSRQWHSGFLPSNYQGVQFLSKGDPVPYTANPPGMDRADQRRAVDAINALNQGFNDSVNDPEIATRISQYETAFRMQMSVPGLMDISDEPAHVLDLYGTRGGAGNFAANCLIARRMAERGVRFIQLYHRGWDMHGGIKRNIEIAANEVDKPAAALISDLKQRGMLDDTLIIWSGEFGRTPMAQGDGRDHHIKGFSLFMAGGGVKGGVSHGETDELGYAAVKDKVHVHDLHATMLHLFGVDHKRLTYRFQGRDFRLTDVHGRVVDEILT